MENKEWIAMILAQGSCLGALTQEVAKPAVPFGGQYRIIDFTLSNCRNSGLDTVGILTQYQPLLLHSYVGNGSAWDLDRRDGGVHILPPFFREQGGEWYKGTADAVYQNVEFIEHFGPEYVVVLSGDHIYKMNYADMLSLHKACQADVTLGVLEVPREETGRFGLIDIGVDGQITGLGEKLRQTRGNQVSMGVYIFSWKVLKQYLERDAASFTSTHDFGKDIIPALLAAGKRIYAYKFAGYWQDVDTISSYWQTNMDILGLAPKLVLDDPDWPVYSPQVSLPPQYHGPGAKVSNSAIAGGVTVLGEVENSIVFPGVYIGPGAKIKDSIIMQYARIERDTTLAGAIITANAVVSPGMAAHAGNGVIPVMGNRQFITAEILAKIERAG
ncbi:MULTISPECIES: glucose-1-phosphate adenylyltransferase [Sporomusa]|uniref:Glucose-1-phosphate adenylyltransferase n=1 Tax=Sporomusa sphaeroides DSM 2875 TaxID=1337886 RepID=A0ABM9W1P2_9FIRM|nr:glucose-1-phosphate adenylyltransferase [Sporomusa sphaeroides]MCM0761400.1 glucose-1-phosphate adenylyltransferase [Sporomusa sphaeroides DSM 2875]OLS56589.1 glucose-1-phosphate adenylyltransferase [Sporomusa sphaeroides DSM 2875]CVK19043.1 Glucose-1-phosphate adenylyltransferase [Sporomusa sphaeroides DSM 2875]